ncbi:MAG: MFS transporter [Candidatus Hydrogenedentota bacterium]
MTPLKLSRWQWTTVFTLTIGYAGYYICRSNFSVATPSLIEEFGAQGLDKPTIGKIATYGTYCYAIGKLFNGVLCDFVGGRRMFLFGMAASIGATVLFGFGSGFTVFLVAWCVNRGVQSMGWGALVKTASRWFPVASLGAVMGILCLSYLFGDFLARLFLGKLLDLGLGWRGMYFVAAGTFVAIFLLNTVLLKASPSAVGEPEPAANEANLFGESGDEAAPGNLIELLLPFFRSFSFWLILLMSLGLTIIRETFNTWTPTYLYEAASLSKGNAGMASSLFPLFGGISALAAGYASDRMTRGQRGTVMLIFLAPSIVTLFLLARVDAAAGVALPLLLISASALFMLGPYTFLSGVISVDLGGKKGSSTAAGLADTAGYLGSSVVSGWGIGAIAQNRGWTAAFDLLAWIMVGTVAAALLYFVVQERGRRRTPVT